MQPSGAHVPASQRFSLNEFSLTLCDWPLRRRITPLPNVSKKREEVNCVPLSVFRVRFSSRLPWGGRSKTPRSTAASASSVRERCSYRCRVRSEGLSAVPIIKAGRRRATSDYASDSEQMAKSYPGELPSLPHGRRSQNPHSPGTLTLHIRLCKHGSCRLISLLTTV
jgi:hypothetical protein